MEEREIKKLLSGLTISILRNFSKKQLVGFGLVAYDEEDSPVHVSEEIEKNKDEIIRYIINKLNQ